MLAIAYAGPVLAHARVSFYVDNLSGLCSIVSGASKRADLAGVACGIQVGMDEFKIKGWYDYVESGSNFTDGGSRIGLGGPLANKYGEPLAEMAFTLPDSYPHSTPSQWREWWRATVPKAMKFRQEVEKIRALSRSEDDQDSIVHGKRREEKQKNISLSTSSASCTSTSPRRSSRENRGRLGGAGR